MKTLKDVVIAVVKEMASNGESFSAHEVTTAVRDYVQAEEAKGVVFDISDGFDGPDVDATFYNHLIEHADVKQLVAEQYRSGGLQRQFNGTYFVYSTAGCSMVSKAVKAAAATPARSNASSDDTEVADRIADYLQRNGPRDLYHVQGAICRAYSREKPMIKIAKLAKIIEQDGRFTIDTNNKTNSWRLVKL